MALPVRVNAEHGVYDQDDNRNDHFFTKTTKYYEFELAKTAVASFPGRNGLDVLRL